MKVRVDQLKCDTTGECVRICPSVFRFQEGSNKAHAIVDVIPKAKERSVVDAVAACPENAIQLLRG